MSARTPTTWVTNPIYLQDVCTPVASIPDGKVIFLTENTPDVGTSNARLSRDVGSAAVLQFWTATDATRDPQLMPILTKSILGGWWEPDRTKKPPMLHPWYNAGSTDMIATPWKGMVAKDIVQVQDFGFVPSGPLAKFGNFAVSLLTVSFESLPYETRKPYSPDDDTNPNWIVKEQENSNNRVQIPFGLYRFKDDNPQFPKLPVIVGNFLVQPMAYITIDIHEVPYEFIYPLDGWNPAESDKYGLVNDDTFMGYDAGTLLLDNAKELRYSDWWRSNMYMLRIYCIWNGWGWQKSPSPAGDLGEVEFIVPSSLTGIRKKPFLTTSFPTFFDRFNPR